MNTERKSERGMRERERKERWMRERRGEGERENLKGGRLRIREAGMGIDMAGSQREKQIMMEKRGEE